MNISDYGGDSNGSVAGSINHLHYSDTASDEMIKIILLKDQVLMMMMMMMMTIIMSIMMMMLMTNIMTIMMMTMIQIMIDGR
jgi:hypothetical protein